MAHFFLVLPSAFIFVFCKWSVYQLGWSNWKFDAMTSALVAATTFVTAFVLSGILADYKLSEGLPTEICSAIEAMSNDKADANADCNRMEAYTHSNYDAVPMQQALADLLAAIYNWLIERNAIAPVLQQIDELSKWYGILEEFSAPPLISRLQAEQAKLRQIVMRIHVIRETNFVPAAYAILELFTAATILALLFVRGGLWERDFILSTALFVAFVYLQLLIRDLDNPFDYSDRSSVDVSLFVAVSTLEN
jgi:hypothetical protein